MSDEWMPVIELPLTIEQFHQLPRNPAYKYEYLQGRACVSPRPKHFHAVLKLADFQPPPKGEVTEDIRLRRLEPEARAHLPRLFAAAFHGVQPFGSLVDAQRLEAARRCLDKTWQGGDGPLLEAASFTAWHFEKDSPLGAILVTLLPGGDPARDDSYHWDEPPAADADAGRTAQAHLTWIFVAPLWKTGGIGAALLAKAVAALKKLGHESLWSTFLLGNDSSLLWHWRNGFALAPYPFSRRAMKRELRK